MPSKQNHDDLVSGDINLLPEDMRHIEEKARTSPGSKERLYEMRSPKRERHRSTFSWLPFFGGDRWETGKSTPVQPEAQKNIPAPVVASNTPPQPPRTARSFGTDRASSGGDSSPVHVLPGVTKASRVRRVGLFSKLFGRRAAQPSAQAFGGTTAIPTSARTTPQQPSRHYSLLSESKSQQGVPSTPPVFGSARDEGASQPVVPVASDVGYGMSGGSRESLAQSGTKPKRSWMLIVFDAFASLFKRNKKSIRPPKPVAHVQPVTESVSYTARPEPSVPVIGRITSQPIQDGSYTPPMQTPDIIPVAPRREQPLPARAPKQKKWLPWWLDIFYLIGLIFGRGKRHVKIRPFAPAQPLQPAALPQSPAPIPSPQPEPVLPAQPVVPQAPMPRIQDIIPQPAPMEPISVVAQPPQVAPTPVTPSVSVREAQPLVAERAPDTPAPTPQAAPRKHGAGFMKRVKDLFVIVHKSNHGEAAPPAASLVNLISGQFQSMRSWPAVVRMMIIAAVASAGVAASAYGGLELVRQNLLAKSTELDSQIARFSNEADTYASKEAEMRALTASIERIESLLKRHIYWTNFFALLEKYTLPDVHYDGLSATTNGSINLSAHGSSFETVSKVIKHLNSKDAKEFVTAAAIASATRSSSEFGSEVSFSIDLTLNSDLFYYGSAEEN